MTSIRQLFKGNVFILTLNTVMKALTLFITFPYFSLYVRELGGSTSIIGLVNALRPLAAMLIYPISGSLTDSYGRVKILVTTGYLNAVLYALYMLAWDWWVLALANFLNGLLVFRFTASSALLADSLPEDLRGRGFAFITAVPNFIGILSPFLGGYLITVFGVAKAMRLLYGATMIATALIATMNWRLLEETLDEGEQNSLWRTIKRSYGDVWDTIKGMPNNLRWYAVTLIIGLFFNSVAGSYWVVYAKDMIGLSEYQWGIILLVATLIQVFTSYPAGSLLDRYGKERILAISLLLATVPIFAFPYSNSFTSTLIVFIPLSVSNGFLIPGAGALMADLVPKERRGRTMAALGRGLLRINYRSSGGGGLGMGFLLTFPSVLGLMTGGLIYEKAAYMPWVLLGSGTLISGVMMAVFIKTGKK
ncbi:MAG: MFS transporter [Candidatus Bathyarchaeia archaeon]